MGTVNGRGRGKGRGKGKGKFTSTMGHAGAIVRHSDGVLEGATDPRSDGAAVGF